MAYHPLRRSFALLTLAIAGSTAPFSPSEVPALANQPPQASPSETTNSPAEQCVTYSPQSAVPLAAADSYLFSPVYKRQARVSVSIPTGYLDYSQWISSQRLYYQSPSSKSADSLPPTEAEIRTAIEQKPTYSSNYEQLIDFLNEHDRQAEAGGIYQQWINNVPSSYWPRLEFGDFLSNQGKWKEAVEVYRGVLEITSDTMDRGTDRTPISKHIYFRIGDAQQIQGKETEALSSYLKGVDPSFFSEESLDGVLINWVMNDDADYLPVYLSTADVQQAERLYKALIVAEPDAAFGYYRLVTLMVSQHRFDEAIALYKTWMPHVSNREPLNVLTFNAYPKYYLDYLRNQKAKYLRQEGRLVEAVEAYRDMLKNSQFVQDMPTQVRLAEALVEKGDLTLAANEYKLIIKQKLDDQRSRPSIDDGPRLDELYVALGTVLTCDGKADEAITAYEKAIALAKESPYGNTGEALPAYHFLGNLQAAQGNLEAAAQSYREVLSFHIADEDGLVSPNDLQQYDALVKQRKWQAAIDQYQQM